MRRHSVRKGDKPCSVGWKPDCVTGCHHRLEQNSEVITYAVIIDIVIRYSIRTEVVVVVEDVLRVVFGKRIVRVLLISVSILLAGFQTAIDVHRRGAADAGESMVAED